MAVTAATALGVLWGKSQAGGREAPPRMNLLMQHLLDTAAVAELMWDHFLAQAVRDAVDECSPDRGRQLFALLSGLHDVGKASPAFQSKDVALAAQVRAAGLHWRPLAGEAQRWHHTVAGAVVVRRVLDRAGWSREAVAWTWPLVAGHHGLVPPVGRVRDASGSRALIEAQGRAPEWADAQDVLVAALAAELDVDLAVVAPSTQPRRPLQLALSGYVVMADWIASSDHFDGVDDGCRVSARLARDRAEQAWASLGLRGGWRADAPAAPSDLFGTRFGRTARPSQLDAVRLAAEMPSPGLLVIEAPMGEGKTESALAAAEVLARRFGADGVFVGMPTQATSDPMYTRVRAWAHSVQADVPVGLLHGKRAFNREWHELTKRSQFHDVHDCDDQYGLSSVHGARPEGAPAEWFLGRKRGLLMPITVGTVDQLLHAATRTKHVMLRHAGLAGKVVVLDEVHAYDVYMAQFLLEALRWLGGARVPVVLLSATLPSALRRDLGRAYLQGATASYDAELPSEPAVAGYPVTRSVCVTDGEPRTQVHCSAPARAAVTVSVEVLDEGPTDPPDAVVALLLDALADGGCALVIRNTVRRAQDTYLALRRELGSDVVLVHARLTIGDRTDRVEDLLARLGPPDRPDAVARPRRLVVVATQIAEQSFDADADLLVADLAPADLLLQRIGRVHRHERAPGARPQRVSTPRVVVTGMRRRAEAPPSFPRGSEYVYGPHLLLRTAALVDAAATGGGWAIPTDVPDVVARCYEPGTDVLPETWCEAGASAHADWTKKEDGRKYAAETFLLDGRDGLTRPTLEGLHSRATGELPDDDAVAAVVRDGPETVEVVLVRRGDRGFATLLGRSIGPNGDAVTDESLVDEVARSAVRLPAPLTKAAKAELEPLPGWRDHPWLGRSRALVLEGGTAVLGGRRLAYDPDLGLVDEPA